LEESSYTEPVTEPEPVAEPVTPEPVAEPLTTEPLTTEPVTEVVAPEVVEPEVVAPEVVAPEVVEPEPVAEVVEPEPVTQEPLAEVAQMEPESNNPELSQAVETVVKYFSNAIDNSVEKKVAEKLEQHNTDTMQNGFDSLNQEVNKMATGGKKTRKFRITNKNKSIHKHL
jgi:hypothetical protein